MPNAKPKEHEKPKKPMKLKKAVAIVSFMLDVRCDPANSMPHIRLGTSEREHLAAMEACRVILAGIDKGS